MLIRKFNLLHAAPADGGQSSGGGAGADPGAQQQQPANQSWYGESHKAIVETKGWKSPTDVLDSYSNLEKLMGADKAGRTVILPKDDKDVEGLKAFRSKMGVPDTADGYELPLPEGDNGELAKAAASWMHEAGVPKAQAQQIATKWNAHIANLVKTETEAAQAKATQELDALKTEWGNDAPKNEEIARRGLQAYGQQAGLDKADLQSLESAIGTAKMLKLFHALGQSTRESSFAGDENGGGGGNGFGISKVAAQQKLDEIRMKRSKGEITDAQWKSTYQAEFERYSQIVASGS